MLILIFSISIQVFFSPDGGARNAIIREIQQAERSVSVAMYILTDRELSNALIEANERGKEVHVVMDGTEINEKSYSKHVYLQKNGVPVRLDLSHRSKSSEYSGIMHHKFAIIDGETVITGSYNWTHSAEELNEENLLIINNSGEICKKFKREFDRIWKRAKSVEIGKVPVLDPYRTDNLKRYVNKWVKIRGKPSNWNISKSGHLFMDFTGKTEEFTFLLWKEGVEKLREEGFDFSVLNYKTVELEGKLIDHEKYGLEIVTENPGAISIK